MIDLERNYPKFVAVYIFVVYSIHIYYSNYVSITIYKNIGLGLLLLGATFSFLSIFNQSVIPAFVNLIIWGNLVYIFPYMVNVGYPIITVQLIIILLSKLKIKRDLYHQLVYVCIMFVVYQYFKMGLLKFTNPLWVSGELLSYYAKAEAGVSLLGYLLSLNKVNSPILSLSAVVIEFSAIGLLFKRTRILCLTALVVFHMSSAAFLKIYEITINYLLFYIMVYLFHNEEIIKNGKNSR